MWVASLQVVLLPTNFAMNQIALQLPLLAVSLVILKQFEVPFVTFLLLVTEVVEQFTILSL